MTPTRAGTGAPRTARRHPPAARSTRYGAGRPPTTRTPPPPAPPPPTRPVPAPPRPRGGPAGAWPRWWPPPCWSWERAPAPRTTSARTTTGTAPRGTSDPAGRGPGDGPSGSGDREGVEPTGVPSGPGSQLPGRISPKGVDYDDMSLPDCYHLTLATDPLRPDDSPATAADFGYRNPAAPGSGSVRAGDGGKLVLGRRVRLRHLLPGHHPLHRRDRPRPARPGFPGLRAGRLRRPGPRHLPGGGATG